MSNPDPIYKTPTAAENPVLDEESVSRGGDEPGRIRPDSPPTEPDSSKYEDLRGTGQETPRPYAMPGEDEGPLGEGGQLRGPDAGGGGSS
jgi:hypothetical protein